MDDDDRQWIEHHGRMRPEKPDRKIWIRFRGGHTPAEPVRAGAYRWEWPADSDYDFDIRWYAKIKAQ